MSKSRTTTHPLRPFNSGGYACQLARHQKLARWRREREKNIRLDSRHCVCVSG